MIESVALSMESGAQSPRKTSTSSDANAEVRNFQDESGRSVASNEYVLNVAFLSFFGFMVLQFGFALLAHSQAMMADCAAMVVDAVTYLFNYAAERVKNKPLTEQEQLLDPDVLHQRKKLQRLYMELIPPLISVTTLAAVTVCTLKESIQQLLDDGPDEYPPDVVIMLIFSALNLLLDVVNVRCFARAEDRVVGLPSSFLEHDQHKDIELGKKGKAFRKESDETIATELTGLLPKSEVGANNSSRNSVPIRSDCDHVDDDDQSTVSSHSSQSNHLNLNMCSAWTHVLADTMRSLTTLVAAGFSWLFPQLVSPSDADAFGAFFISIIIIVSLGPLIQGLFSTFWEIRDFYHNSSSVDSDNIAECKEEPEPESCTRQKLQGS